MKPVRKTKIVATIGPASSNERTLTKMVREGVNVVRLNFSHGDHAGHKEALDLVRRVSKKTNIPVAVVQDLGGPKIRTGAQYKDAVFLKKGRKVVLTTKPVVGDEERLYVNYKKLPKEVRAGTVILLDDGRKKLEVISKGKTSVTCKVLVGGNIKPYRGVNLPGVSLSISSLTAKDKKDVLFGIKHGVDFIALSFVRKASDVQGLRHMLAERGTQDIGIIAKIETHDAVENIDNIIEEADGVMVARGDLAVEMPPEDVPLLQKQIIKKCNLAGTPAVIATQMLESMIHAPVPTRAEVNDVANSIFDGADAIMLSAETAIGEYPIDVVTTMSDVARKTESGFPHWEVLKRARKLSAEDSGAIETADAVTYAGVRTAYDVGAKVIAALTESGFTARMIARYRAQQPIVVLSPNDAALRKIVLSYGCYPVKITSFEYVGEAIDRIKRELRTHKFARKEEKFVIAAGVPFGKTGGTNMIVVHSL